MIGILVRRRVQISASLAMTKSLVVEYRQVIEASSDVGEQAAGASSATGYPVNVSKRFYRPGPNGP
jgi:hypothetical protein